MLAGWTGNTGRTTNCRERIWYILVPLAEVKDVKLEFLLELDLDVTNDEERHREVDVDPPVIPPDLVDLRQVWSNAGLLNLELKQEGLILIPNESGSL